MRLTALLMLMMLSACGGTYASLGVGEQSAQAPSMGSDAQRDGFYDGGVYDPDLTRRDLPLSE